MELEFNALTCIDTVSNLVELVRMKNKTLLHIKQQFENTWLSRYPQPVCCIHDNGGEFTEFEFQTLLSRFGIDNAPTLPQNPQANAICERMHQVVDNTLKMHLHGHELSSEAKVTEVMDTALAIAMFATRATIHHALQTLPGTLTFKCYMVLALPLMSNMIVVIQERQQQIIDKELLRQNSSFNHDYKVNDKILLKIPDRRKLDPRFTGLYKVIQVHTNGILTIQKSPTVCQQINIRTCKPFVRPGEAE